MITRPLRQVLTLVIGATLLMAADSGGCIFGGDDPPAEDPVPTSDPRCGETGCTELPSPFRNARCAGPSGTSCDAAAGLVCAGGFCRCREGGHRCDGRCVDLDVDPLHCGSCRHSCGGQACDAGVCDCPEGLRMCEGYCQPDDFFSAREAHCGACDALCVGTCVRGECIAVVDIALSGGSSLVALSNGSVWVWGSNRWGQLGSPPEGDDDWDSSTRHIPGIEGAVTVSMGSQHGCALQADGQVLCWGRNVYGALGPSVGFYYYGAVEVADLYDVVDISVGDHHSCALTSDGRVYTWGANGNGQLGAGVVTQSRPEPALIPGLEGVIELECAGNMTCVRDTAGVRCLGSLWSLTGDPDTAETLAFRAMPVPDAPIQQMAVSSHICFVSGSQPDPADGRLAADDWAVHCFGKNDEGQVTEPPSEGAGLIRMPHFVSRDPPVAVTAAYTSTCALTEDGEVRCWGDNFYSQLALPYDREPVVNDVDLRSPAIAIAGGGHHYCALLENGELRCWGWSRFGQVGTSSYDNRIPEPRRVRVPW